MTFQTILRAIMNQYKVSCCYIADNMHIEDEVVEEWEKGTKVPDEEELKKFSDMFALPMKLLLDSVKEKTE